MSIPATRFEPFDFRRAVKERIKAGEVDPRAIATALLDQLTPELREKMLWAGLVYEIRGIYSELRAGSHVAQPSGERTKPGPKWSGIADALLGVPYLVPGIGYKSLRDLTADECDSVASSYEELAAENAAIGARFRGLAKVLRESRHKTVGKLAKKKIAEVLQ